MDFEFKDKYDINDLISLITLLRAPGGCPWDREQTHTSIKSNFIEETYEVIEAINQNSISGLREELGDVLLQIALHCEMESEKGNFDFDDVCDNFAKSLLSVTLTCLVTRLQTILRKRLTAGTALRQA